MSFLYLYRHVIFEVRKIFFNDIDKYIIWIYELRFFYFFHLRFGLITVFQISLMLCVSNFLDLICSLTKKPICSTLSSNTFNFSLPSLVFCVMLPTINPVHLPRLSFIKILHFVFSLLILFQFSPICFLHLFVWFFCAFFVLFKGLIDFLHVLFIFV